MSHDACAVLRHRALGGGFVYPLHQSHADSDRVWFAVEHHADRT